MKTILREKLGEAVLGDSAEVLRGLADSTVNLVVTSPPYALILKKEYGNACGTEYLDWFRPFAAEVRRVLRDDGSLVIDIGGAWLKGQPTRSLYHFKLLIMLCEEFGLHLAQEFYWWNPAKLPSPAEWVTVRKIRVKDAVDCVWWLSKTPWPKASNRRVLQPYSDRMKKLIKDGPEVGKRPSGHDVTANFCVDNGASIPPNLIALPNTESNSPYQRYCREHGIKPHPARFPVELPEFFVRMLTDEGDLVVDPFAGSCTVGEACERLGRRWLCVDCVEEYLAGATGRFGREDVRDDEGKSYSVPKVSAGWPRSTGEPLDPSGGRERRRPAR